MLSLPNGCRCSNLSVTPKDWQTAKHDLKKDWFISYRFYDPAFDKPKQVVIKGMNTHKTIAERRAVTKSLLDEELYMLQVNGYNPFHGRFIEQLHFDCEVDPNTLFLPALKIAKDKLLCSRETGHDIKSVLKYFSQSVIALGLDKFRITDIRKKHIRLLLDHLARTKKNWSANQHNHYRKYLSILFSQLCEMEAVDFNPVIAIKKQKTVQRLRTMLTAEERIRINIDLKEQQYHFWRFIQLFFHSGARESELMQLKHSDVDLSSGYFKVLIKKGNTHTEKLRPIKTIAAPLWAELMKEAKPGEFLFSKNLQPGPSAINPRQLTRRWREHVKKKLKIDADLYSLKHLNLDETAAALSIGDAAAMAGHSTPVITMKHYATGEAKRQMEKLKTVTNSF